MPVTKILQVYAILREKSSDCGQGRGPLPDLIERLNLTGLIKNGIYEKEMVVP